MAFNPRELVKDQHNQLVCRTDSFKFFKCRYAQGIKRYTLCRYSGRTLIPEGLFLSDNDIRELACLLYEARKKIDKKGGYRYGDT